VSEKPFASSEDLAEKVETFEVIAPGVYAMSAEGDPNVGAIEARDYLICIEARATPVAAQSWLRRLREETDKPIRYLVLSHYHAVRVLGASAFGAEEIVAHTNTRDLILERGKEDWDSEFQRMPRLFKEPESIPGLTYPTMVFRDHMEIDLGGDRGTIHLSWLGKGHTKGDIVVWLPREKVLFAGDLVEAEAALYTGDAYHLEWASSTLDKVKSLGAEVLVGGRGKVVFGEQAVVNAIEQSRDFLNTLISETAKTIEAKGTLKDAFDAVYKALAPKYATWPIFEHTVPFDVARVFDELNGIADPIVWTKERDLEIWNQLQR